MNKKRKLIIVLTLALIVLVSVIAIIVIAVSRPLLSSEDTVSSILGSDHFQILHGSDFEAGVDVTHLVDMDELFVLLSQTETRRISGRAHRRQQSYHTERWLLRGMGRSHDDSLRGRIITLSGTEGVMFGEVEPFTRTFRLSNADEIVAFLEQSTAES